MHLKKYPGIIRAPHIDSALTFISQNYKLVCHKQDLGFIPNHADSLSQSAGFPKSILRGAIG